MWVIVIAKTIDLQESQIESMSSDLEISHNLHFSKIKSDSKIKPQG